MGKKRPRPVPDVKCNIGVKFAGGRWHLGVLIVRGLDVYFEVSVTNWPDSLKFSYHETGQRHVKLGTVMPTRLFGAAPEIREPIDRLTQRELIAAITILGGDLERQPKYGDGIAPSAPGLLLDADGADFRGDDMIFFRIYLVPSGIEPAAPNAANVGPIVQELVTLAPSLPRVAVCIFQERAAAGAANQ